MEQKRDMPYFAQTAPCRHQVARQYEMDTLVNSERFHQSLPERALRGDIMHTPLWKGARPEPARQDYTPAPATQRALRRFSAFDENLSHRYCTRTYADFVHDTRDMVVSRQVFQNETSQKFSSTMETQANVLNSLHHQQCSEERVETCGTTPESLNNEAGGRKVSFPEVLMDLLSREDVENIISWLPNGKSFAIHRPEEFECALLPKYFTRMKYASFTRKLNRWGFRQILKGPNQGAFHHKLFQKDNPLLCLKMFYRKGGTSSSTSMEKNKSRGGVIQRSPPVSVTHRVMIDDVEMEKKMLDRYRSIPHLGQERQVLAHSQRVCLPPETTRPSPKTEDRHHLTLKMLRIASLLSSKNIPPSVRR